MKHNRKSYKYLLLLPLSLIPVYTKRWSAGWSLYWTPNSRMSPGPGTTRCRADYHDYYTFSGGAMTGILDVMFSAYRQYGDEQYLCV